MVMYDLTARQSFLDVRQWLSSVEVSCWPAGKALLLGPLGAPDSDPTFSRNKPVQASMCPSTQVPSIRLVTGDL